MIAAKIEVPQISRELRGWVMWLFAFLVVGFHILLPIGNALPTVHFGAVPVHMQMLVYPFFFIPALNLCKNNPSFRRGLRLLALLLFIQTLSLCFSSDLLVNGYAVFYNFWGLIGTYLVASYIVSVVKPKVFVNAILIAFVLAAFVGIFERIFRTPMWPYQVWYEDFVSRLGYNPFADDLLDIFRIQGTGGNPIIYAVVMMLGVAWAYEVTNKFLRWALIVLFVIAAMNTLSRTIILFLIPYSIFFAIRFFSKKPLRNLVLLAVVLLCLSPLLLLPIDKLKDLWYLRITIDESLGADSAISIRQTIISNVWAELTNIWNLPYYFFGHGQGSGAIIARRALSTTDTLDNEYLALLYENGLLGLCTFLLFWLSPFFQGVKKFKTNIHLWAIIGFLLAGCSFEIIKYTNINFLIFCSLAWIQLKAPSLKSTEFPA